MKDMGQTIDGYAVFEATWMCEDRGKNAHVTDMESFAKAATCYSQTSVVV